MRSEQTPNPIADESKESAWLREHRENANQLLRNIKQHLPKLEKTLA